MIHQLLVGLVVIGIELGREDHGSTPQLRSGEGWNHLIPELTPKPNSAGGESQKK
jgi:hypothetical protein